jgi:uncharacterized protein YecE (DUF72 family)
MARSEARDAALAPMMPSPDHPITPSPDVPLVFVGTSGWAYPAWKPVFFPAKLAQKKFLQYYATRLNAVEVNYSFRHFIAETTLENWIADTPPGFAFCVKAHQAITHIRRLKNTEEPLRRFLESVQPLATAGKLGSLLFQLPPNLKADAELLDSFLSLFPRVRRGEISVTGRLQPVLRPTFEFRHSSWFQEPIYEVLRRHNAALCLAESDELATPDIVTANFSYYRFRRSEYSAEARNEIAARLSRRAANGHAVFAFFKHEESPESALWAEQALKTARD